MTVETIALKHMARRRGATTLLLAGITLSMTISVALFSLVSTLNQRVGDLFDEIGPNLVVRPKGMDTAASYAGIRLPGDSEAVGLTARDYIAINTIENKDNVAAVAPKILQEVSLGEEQLILAGVYFQFEKIIKKWWRFDGAWPFAEDEIMVGSKLSETTGSGVGDTLEIAGKRFHVTAVLKPQHTEEDHMAFANILTVQELFHRPGEISFIEVAAYCTTCPLPVIAQQIREKIPGADVFSMQDVVKAREATVGRFSSYAFVASSVVLLVVGIVVSLLMMASTNDRASEIGTLRSAGYRRSAIVELVLTEASIVGVSGGLIGYVLGVFLAKLLTYGFDLSPSDIGWDPFFGSLILLASTGLGIVAGLAPALAAARIDPVRALKQS